MKNQNSNKELLNSTYQTGSMGVFAIDQIFNAIQNQKLAILVLKQKDKYEEIMKKCENLADQLALDISDISMMLKANSFASIKIKSMFNDQTDHLADMLIQGTTMGVTTIIKAFGDYGDADEKVKAVAKDMQTALEEFVDSLKLFLTINQ